MELIERVDGSGQTGEVRRQWTDDVCNMAIVLKHGQESFITQIRRSFRVPEGVNDAKVIQQLYAASYHNQDYIERQTLSYLGEALSGTDLETTDLIRRGAELVREDRDRSGQPIYGPTDLLPAPPILNQVLTTEEKQALADVLDFSQE